MAAGRSRAEALSGERCRARGPVHRWTSARRHAGAPRGAPKKPCMGITVRRITDESDLERELLRQGVDGRGAEQRRCDRCHRTPLIGERVAHYEGGDMRCELCASMHRERPVSETLVKHAPDGPSSRVRVIRKLPV